MRRRSALLTLACAAALAACGGDGTRAPRATAVPGATVVWAVGDGGAGTDAAKQRRGADRPRPAGSRDLPRRRLRDRDPRRVRDEVRAGLRRSRRAHVADARATTTGPTTPRATTRSGERRSAAGSRTTTRARPAAGRCSRPTRRPRTTRGSSPGCASGWPAAATAGSSSGTARTSTPACTATTRSDVTPLWDAVEGRAAIALAGHDHNMQRFKPAGGTTEYVSGAGGKGRYARRRERPPARLLRRRLRRRAPDRAQRPAAPTCASSPPTARSSTAARSPARAESGAPRRYARSVLVGVAQLVELRVVVPAAAGSSPVAHPLRPCKSRSSARR